MDQTENLRSRRSIRKFTDEKLNKEQIEALVEAGRYAPTGMNSQKTAFIAIQDPEWKNVISRLNADVMRQNNPEYAADPFYGADTYIAVLADAGQGTWLQNGSCALQNILQAADQMGLGAVWINRCKEVFESEEGRKLLEPLDIPQGYTGVGFAAVGYPAMEKPEAMERKSIVRMVL